MKLIVDIPESLMRKVYKTIEIGRCPDLSTFFVISAENQLLLEGSDEGVIHQQKMRHFSRSRRAHNNETTPYKHPDIVLEMKKSNFNLLANLTLEPPTFEQVNWAGAEREEDLWLWGQYNRILPVKVAARLLAIAQTKVNGLLVFSEWRKEAANLARQVGMSILRQDEARARRRDEKLSVAFPVGKEKEKTLSRFENQYLGNVRTDGLLKLSGAIMEMKFANVKIEGEETLIGLTPAGLQFAKLSNDLLDNNDFTEPLNDDEAGFYLSHVITALPGEKDAISMLVRLIHEGVNTRSALDEAVKERFGDRWSDATRSTLRAGAMSRIFELGLIEKERKGVRVLYRVSDRGEKVLDRF